MGRGEFADDPVYSLEVRCTLGHNLTGNPIPHSLSFFAASRPPFCRSNHSFVRLVSFRFVSFVLLFVGAAADRAPTSQALIPPSILPLAQDSTSGARQNRRGGAGGGVGGIGGWMQDKYYRHFSGGRGTTSGGDGGSSGGGGGGQYDRL